ncbi:MAG: hypothetical protein EOO28_24460 [Comamonadaceae bacterium]|nr:MAG: hypothetical protein EOO28_24460 [Comamonadaceae bacterium]
MSAIGHVIKSITDGIGEGIKGVGNIIGGALSLNPKQMVDGAAQVLTAPAVAANSLIGGGVNQMMSFGLPFPGMGMGGMGGMGMGGMGMGGMGMGMYPPGY